MYHFLYFFYESDIFKLFGSFQATNTFEIYFIKQEMIN